jgi:hypothetical protein
VEGGSEEEGIEAVRPRLGTPEREETIKRRGKTEENERETIQPKMKQRERERE